MFANSDRYLQHHQIYYLKLYFEAVREKKLQRVKIVFKKFSFVVDKNFLGWEEKWGEKKSKIKKIIFSITFWFKKCQT